MAPEKHAESNNATDTLDDGGTHLRHICLEYSFRQLETATAGFDASRRLGSGMAGTVYRGTMPDGLDVAIKVIDPATLGSESGVAGFQEEIAVLSKFRHPNLVTLMGWARHESRRFLVYECLPGGDVLQRLLKCKELGGSPFFWHERLNVAIDAATGLAHLHNAKPKAFHRDIKSSNILLGAGGAKMADFGLACVAKTRAGADVACEFASGTPGYSCPNYVRTGKVTEGSEVFSFGMVLLELLVNQLVAGMTGDNRTVYPVEEILAPLVPHALQRCHEHADPLAGWLPAVINDVAPLALSCVAPEEYRPCFNDVCRALRGIRDRHPPGSSVAPAPYSFPMPSGPSLGGPAARAPMFPGGPGQHQIRPAVLLPGPGANLHGNRAGVVTPAPQIGPVAGPLFMPKPLLFAGTPPRPGFGHGVGIPNNHVVGGSTVTPGGAGRVLSVSAGPQPIVREAIYLSAQQAVHPPAALARAVPVAVEPLSGVQARQAPAAVATAATASGGLGQAQQAPGMQVGSAGSPNVNRPAPPGGAGTAPWAMPGADSATKAVADAGHTSVDEAAAGRWVLSCIYAQGLPAERLRSLPEAARQLSFKVRNGSAAALIGRGCQPGIFEKLLAADAQLSSFVSRTHLQFKACDDIEAAVSDALSLTNLSQNFVIAGESAVLGQGQETIVAHGTIISFAMLAGEKSQTVMPFLSFALTAAQPLRPSEEATVQQRMRMQSVDSAGQSLTADDRPHVAGTDQATVAQAVEHPTSPPLASTESAPERSADQPEGMPSQHRVGQEEESVGVQDVKAQVAAVLGTPLSIEAHDPDLGTVTHNAVVAANIAVAAPAQTDAEERKARNQEHEHSLGQHDPRDAMGQKDEATLEVQNIVTPSADNPVADESAAALPKFAAASTLAAIAPPASLFPSPVDLSPDEDCQDPNPDAARTQKPVVAEPAPALGSPVSPAGSPAAGCGKKRGACRCFRFRVPWGRRS